MEALQVCPSRTETLFKPSRHSVVSYLDRVTSRLATIPPTPSVVPDPTLCEHGSLEALSILTPTTTATEPPSEVCTAATSVESLPEIIIIQKLYVSPSMPIDDKLKLVWTGHIRSRLSAILLQSIPKGTCVQEFMMVGKKATALKPTIVITCGDAATKKRVEKSFKCQSWLQDLIKEKGIMFVALVAKTTLSAGPVLDHTDTTMLSECYSLQVNYSTETSCGRVILVNNSDHRAQRYCTLGGLFMVNGKVYGLTAGHPFAPQLEQESVLDEGDVIQGSRLLEDEDEENSSENSSETSSETSTEPFLFNDDEDDLGDLSSVSTVSSPSHDGLSALSIKDRFHNISETFSQSATWSEPYNAIIPLSTHQADDSLDGIPGEWDWALLEMLPQSSMMLPNKIVHPDSHEDVLVERIVSGLAEGQVTILGNETELGFLHSSPVTMKVNEVVLNVELITLEHNLPLGSSGAWVILGDKLCGFIVAVRQDVPWAYMMAIETVLEDIKRKLGTADVRLPRRGEIESLTEVSDVPECIDAAKEVSQTPVDDKMQASKPATDLWKVLSARSMAISKASDTPEILSEKQSHSSPQQQEEVLDEKTSQAENVLENSVSIQAASTLQVSSNTNEANDTASGYARPTSLPAFHLPPLPSVSSQPTQPAIIEHSPSYLETWHIYALLIHSTFWYSFVPFLYAVFCFPCSFVAAYRRRDIPPDEERPRRQQIETREMQGPFSAISGSPG